MQIADNFRLEGKVAIVTGASKGQGRISQLHSSFVDKDLLR